MSNFRKSGRKRTIVNGSNRKKLGALIGGGLVAAFAASICCIGPLVLTVVGVSGAASLAKFDFLQIPMIIVVVGLFAYAGYDLFKRRDSCGPGSICANPKKYRLLVFTYIVGLIVAFLAIASPYWVVWLFD